MKKIILIIFCVIVSIIGIKDIEATIVRKSTKENVPSSLSNFSNKLYQTHIYNTDKFNCSASGCISYSDFNSKVGLLSNYEYNTIGINSYLYNPNSYFVLDNNSIKEMTTNGINTGAEESAIRASIYLKKGVKVTGSGSVNDPFTIGRVLRINVEHGLVNTNVVNLNNLESYSFLITPDDNYSLEDAEISCTKGANGLLNNNGKLEISNVRESQVCSVSLKQSRFTVRLTNLSNVSSAVTELIVNKGTSAMFQLIEETNYTFEKANATCTNGVANVSSSGVLTVSDIGGDSECTVSLGLTDHIVSVEVLHGTVTNGENTQIVNHSGTTTFDLAHEEYYIFDNASVICTNATGSVSSSGVLTVSNVVNNASCTVNFELTSHTVTVSVTNGSSNKSSETVEHGTNATFTITPDSTYTLSGANISCTNGNGELNNGVLTVSGLIDDSNCNVELNRVQTLVSFIANGGSGGTNSIIATYSENMPNISLPSRNGYNFLGYYDATSGGTQYYTSSGASARTWNKTVSSTTLYARWTPLTLVDKILELNPTRLTRSDFSSALTSNNTGTLYTTTNTEDGSTVYYFAGNALNNWVKFGKCTPYYYDCNNGEDLYWRIIRTNTTKEDGGVRLFYVGDSMVSQGTGYTHAYINFGQYSSNVNNPMYVGYMYGSGGSLANNRTNTNKSNPALSISTWYTQGFNNSNNANSKDASGNLYHNYVSLTAIYCNDRSVGSGTYHTGNSGGDFYFGSYTRLVSNKTPSYACGASTSGYPNYFSTANVADKFTGSTTNASGVTIGNGKLGNTPAALITADELAFAGGLNGSTAKPWYFLNNNNAEATGTKGFWTMTPAYHRASENWASVFGVRGANTYDGGRLTFDDTVGEERGYRPVLSLKASVLWDSGDGSFSNPFTVKLN